VLYTNAKDDMGFHYDYRKSRWRDKGEITNVDWKREGLCHQEFKHLSKKQQRNSVLPAAIFLRSNIMTINKKITF
jgi:hypothetical protein